jgi:acetyl-CoA carboxylase carboxyl transferase subunit alpha
VGGAHRRREQVIEATGDAVARSLNAFAPLSAEALRIQRREKFLAIGRG